MKASHTVIGIIEPLDSLHLSKLRRRGALINKSANIMSWTFTHSRNCENSDTVPLILLWIYLRARKLKQQNLNRPRLFALTLQIYPGQSHPRQVSRINALDPTLPSEARSGTPCHHEEAAQSAAGRNLYGPRSLPQEVREERRGRDTKRDMSAASGSSGISAPRSDSSRSCKDVTMRRHYM